MNMKSINISIAALLILGFLSPVASMAQEVKRVEVTTIYNPEVAVAPKLLPPTVFEDEIDVETDIDFEVEPKALEIVVDNYDYYNRPDVSYADWERIRNCHANVGVAYPLSSAASLSFLTQNIRVGYFGAGVNHLGDFMQRSNADGVKRSIADSYSIENEAYVFGGLVVGRKMFEAVARYDYDIFNRYAVLTSPSRLSLHDGSLALRFGDSFLDLSRVNFAVEAHGSYWHYLPAMGVNPRATLSEYRAGGELRLARDFRGNTVGLKAMYDMWSATDDSYRDMRFGATVEYSRIFGIMSLDASLGYMYDKINNRAKASHFVLPAVKLRFDFGIDALMPYVELNTTVSQNGPSSLQNINPYIGYDVMRTALSTLPSTRSYNLAIGLNGSVASRLGYHLSFGANFMRDQVLWYVNEVGSFGVAPCSNNRLFVKADVEYHPIGGLLIAASFYAHADNKVSEFTTNDARMKAGARAEYTYNRWQFGISGNYTSKRNWSIVDAVEGGVVDRFVAPAYFDLSANVSFKVKSNIEVYLDASNLLNRRIYDFAYYYAHGIGVMAGVKIDF